MGSDWADDYNFVYGNTDIANVGSGWFAYNDDFAGRASRAIHYKSPDFNGLQVAARAELDGGNDNDGDTDANGNSVNDSELDAWNLSAKYAFSGFTVAGSYTTRPDYIAETTNTDVASPGNLLPLTSGTGLITDGDIPLDALPATTGDMQDKTAWALGATYGQDNWNVATWYGENNASDYGYHCDADSRTADNPTGTGGITGADCVEKQDETVFSIAGNVNIGPTGVYVVHETKENLIGLDDALTSFGVQYNFNSKAKTWIEYSAFDFESDPTAEDFVTIGLRHDF